MAFAGMRDGPPPTPWENHPEAESHYCGDKTVTTVDCRRLWKANQSEQLDGIRLWFVNENYYVIVGVPPGVSYAMATNGRSAVSKYWDQPWSDYDTQAAEDAGYWASNRNIYYFYGNGLQVAERLWDFAQKTEDGMGAQGYDWFEGYHNVIYHQVKRGLIAQAESWESTFEEHADVLYRRQRAKEERENEQYRSRRDYDHLF